MRARRVRLADTVEGGVNAPPPTYEAHAPNPSPYHPPRQRVPEGNDLSTCPRGPRSVFEPIGAKIAHLNW